MALQHLRSGTANKRPIPTVMSAGQLAINTNEGSPGLFFKDSNGDLVKVGPVHIGTSAPNSSPDSLAATALVTGTVYQILTVGNSDFTLVGASANTVGTVFTATGTTTGTGTVSGQQGNEKGEQWLDTTGSAFDLKIYDGTAWRSQAGEFVNVTGDTMTGAFGVVAGTTSAPGVFFSGDTDTGIYSPGSNQFGISTAGTSRVVVDASGNVGIGETNPDALLVVKGNSDGSTTPSIRLKDGSDTREAWITNTAGDLALNVGGDDNVAHGTLKLFESGILDYAQATGSKLRIDSSGKVGIGCTPVRDLQLHTSDASSELMLSNSTTGATAGSGFMIQQDGNDNYIWNKENSFMSFGTNALERLRIDADGDVGIGTGAAINLTAAGRQTLALNGNSETAISFSHSGSLAAFLYTSSTEFRMQSEISVPLVFRPNNSEAMRIDSSGNVGIGLTSVSSSRRVEILQPSSYSAALRIKADGSGNDGDIEWFTGLSQFGLGVTQGTDAIRFRRESAELMRIDSSGNVRFQYDDASTSTSTQVPPGLRINNTNNTLGRLAGIHFSHGGAGTANAGIFHVTTSTTTSSTGCLGDLAFYMKASGASTMTERMRIDSSGRLLIGTSSAPAGTDAQYSRFALRGNTINDNACYLSLGNGKTTANTTSSDNLGIITFNDNDSDAGEYARITGATDGANGTNDYPGKLIFSTTSDGGSSPTECLRLNSANQMTGPAVDFARVLTLLYARLKSHGGCSTNGPSGTFTEFDSGEESFQTVGRAVTNAPSNYSFIGNNFGAAFSFFVGCGDNPMFTLSNKDNDAGTYHSWVVVHQDFVAALGGLPTNTTRTLLP